MIEYILQQGVNAVQLGSIYALIALGYSLVYGVLTMINFAHGDVFMVGAFLCLFLALTEPMPFFIILILVMIGTAALGGLIERIAYRPLRSAPRVSAIITALGCGLILENTMLSFYPYPIAMPPLIGISVFSIGGIYFSSLQILIVMVSLMLMVGLDFVIRKTPFGMAMRATSFDVATVPLMGISANRIINLTFVLGAALAGAAGVLYSAAYPVVSATMGALVGWKAFVAAVVGGIGNLRGAVVGAYVLGAVEVLTVAFLPSTYRDFIVYSMLLVILIFKPYGLLGRPPNQKV